MSKKINDVASVQIQIQLKIYGEILFKNGRREGFIHQS